MTITATSLTFRGNQWVRRPCTEPLPAIIGLAVRHDPTLDAQRKQVFLNGLDLLRTEGPCQFHAVVYGVLLQEDNETIAGRKGTTPDAIRMAKMRGMRNLRRNVGPWVDGFIEAIHDAR